VDISTFLYESSGTDPARSGFAAVMHAGIDNFAISRLHCLQMQDVIHPADLLLAAHLPLVHAPPEPPSLLDMVIDSGDDYHMRTA